MKNSYKDLLSDTVVFMISNFGSKFLVFLMLPLYTSELSTAEYGIIDLLYNLIIILHPVLTVSVCDATLRFSLSQSDDFNNIFKNAIIITFVSFLFFYVTLLLVGHGLDFIYNNRILVCLFYITYSLEICISNFIKGLKKTKIFAIKGIIFTISMILSNILFLVYFKLGIEGYFTSLIISNLISIFFLFYRTNLFNFFYASKFDYKLIKEMILYGIPMAISSIGWFFNAYSDKYMISIFLGVSSNGLYAAAHKISSVFSTITGIFSQAWRISSISNFQLKNSEASSFYSNVYKNYCLICMYACIIIISLSMPIANVMFSSNFYNSWVIIPLLVTSSLFAALSAFLDAIFDAAKNTKILAISTCLGALINIVMNYFLLHILGLRGAAIATILSFLSVWVIRSIYIKNIVILNIHYLKLFASIISLILYSLYYSYNGSYKIVFCFITLMILYMTNRHDTNKLIIYIFNLIKQKRMRG